MLSFNCFEKRLGIASLPHFVNHFFFFSRKMFLILHLLTDQIPLHDCLYFLIYLTTCVLQFFVNRVVTPEILKVSLSF